MNQYMDIVACAKQMIEEAVQKKKPFFWLPVPVKTRQTGHHMQQ